MARAVFVDRSASERTSFKELIERYIRDVTPLHKGAQAERLRLERFVRNEPSLSVRFMSNLRTHHFEEYRDRRLKEVKPGTVKRELNLLHAVIESERKKLGLIENPISDVKRPKANDQRAVRLSPADEKKLLAEVDTARNKFLKAAVILAIETAMRRGELLSLTWDNVDFVSSIAHLPETKIDVPRDVPLSPRAISVLLVLMCERRNDPRVLPTSAEAIKNAFERARKRAGLQHVNFHDLRHEAASRLFERGLSIEKVAIVTGHKDWQSLKRYTHLKASDVAKELG